MAQTQANANQLADIPPEIVERLMNHHHMSWVSLSSPFRMQEDCTQVFRQPDFSSWIQIE